MTKTLIALSLAVALTGCATGEYKLYAESQMAIATAKSNAEAERYKALAGIATNGTETSKIAAVMALALGQPGQSNTTQIAAPAPNEALQWASILVPSITNIAGMHYNAKVSMAANENSTRVAESTNSAFLGIAGKIQAPVVAAPVNPQANVSTVTTTTSTDNHAVTTSNDNHSVATTTTSTANPSTTTSTTSTMSGTGVLGSGTYTANPSTTTSTLSGTGTLGSGAYNVTNPSGTTAQIPPGKVCSVTVATGLVNCI